MAIFVLNYVLAPDAEIVLMVCTQWDQDDAYWVQELANALNRPVVCTADACGQPESNEGKPLAQKLCYAYSEWIRVDPKPKLSLFPLK